MALCIGSQECRNTEAPAFTRLRSVDPFNIAFPFHHIQGKEELKQTPLRSFLYFWKFIRKITRRNKYPNY